MAASPRPPSWVTGHTESSAGVLGENRSRACGTLVGARSGRSVGLEVDVMGVEVGGGVEAIGFPKVSYHSVKAPNKRASGTSDGQNKNDPTVKTHGFRSSRIRQTRTARAMSRRKRMRTAATKSRVIRTEGWVRMASMFSDPFWCNQITKTVRR